MAYGTRSKFPAFAPRVRGASAGKASTYKEILFQNYIVDIYSIRGTGFRVWDLRFEIWCLFVIWNLFFGAYLLILMNLKLLIFK